MKNNTAVKKSITRPSIKSSMNKSMNQQKGLTLISWMVIIVFFMFQVVIAMNVLPVYITDASVKSIITELPNDLKAKQASGKELKVLINKRLGINGVYSVQPKHIKVKRGRGETVVTIEYEPRGQLIGNLEFIVSFKHEARIKNR